MKFWLVCASCDETFDTIAAAYAHQQEYSWEEGHGGYDAYCESEAETSEVQD